MLRMISFVPNIDELVSRYRRNDNFGLNVVSIPFLMAHFRSTIETSQLKIVVQLIISIDFQITMKL